MVDLVNEQLAKAVTISVPSVTKLGTHVNMIQDKLLHCAAYKHLPFNATFVEVNYFTTSYTLATIDTASFLLHFVTSLVISVTTSPILLAILADDLMASLTVSVTAATTVVAAFETDLTNFFKENFFI